MLRQKVNYHSTRRHKPDDNTPVSYSQVQFVLYSIKDFSSARRSEITTATPREGLLRGLLRIFLSSLNAPHSLLSVHCVKTKKLLLVYDFTFFSCGSYANFEKRGWQLICVCVCV